MLCKVENKAPKGLAEKGDREGRAEKNFEKGSHVIWRRAEGGTLQARSALVVCAL